MAYKAFVPKAKRDHNSLKKAKKKVDKQSALCDIETMESEQGNPTMDDFLSFIDSLEVDLLAPTSTPVKDMKTEVLNRGAYGHWEPCPKCNGTGLWRGVKMCFTCKGQKGKSYKTSKEDRDMATAKRNENKLAKVEEFKRDNPEVFAWITSNAGPQSTNNFAVSLMTNLAKYGSLTDNQVAAVQRGIDKAKAAKEQAAKRFENAPEVDFSRIEKAFDSARSKADRPNAKGVWLKPLNLQVEDHTITFEKGTNKWEGFVFINEKGKKLGYLKGGKFVAKFECSDSEQAAVIEACQDPWKAAIAYGKAWSQCACCGRTLTNDESIERGIGPICAERLMG